jgi:hypothetical protein
MSAQLEGVRVALGELYPTAVLAGISLSELGFHYPEGSPRHPDVLKANRLTRMHLEGPEVMTVCDRHSDFGRPDVWARCGLVPVRDALRGHTCGVAA